MRLSGAKDVKLINLQVEELENSTPFGSKLCGDYSKTSSKFNAQNGFTGNDLRGKK